MFRQEDRQGRKKGSLGKIIGLILVLLTAMPEEMGELLGVLIGIALVLSPVIIPLVIWFRRKKHKEQHQRALQNTTFGTCEKQKSSDERIQDLFCFHKDKAEHHVSRGKEIDPWDRPDIDISKYQRKE